jgi:hypothetical protein
MVRLTVSLRGFAEARTFFGCLQSSHVVIEDYSRKEDPRRSFSINSGPPDNPAP